MKPKFRPVLEQCLENGIRRGYYRAHKHNENPTQESIFSEIEDCIMSELYEWFTLPVDEDFEK